MSDTEYQKNRHSCYYLKYHLVIVIKYGHPVLGIDKIKNRLLELSYRLIEKDLDHVHILFFATPQVQLSKLFNNYKNVTFFLV